ncbi:X2-like carbohydrate binding domain-containing protein [Gorillibacterium massiliense]|uniref:X2-like carbohydrate binding domain-containing protein n=1 Tax=Gorillibacterium massiliense TaxID=1280390 RepID=UPI000593C07F|nr:X2-like carbohydrate binding domain-containing protein [Gorillibacterium massiliense]
MIGKRMKRVFCALVGFFILVSAYTTYTPSIAHAAPSVAYNWNNVNTGAGGGFIPGIIFNTAQKDLIYARTDIGGVYRWNSTTSSWKQLLDFVGWTDWSKYGVDALATDPVDPNRVYIAAGTYTNDWDPNNGYIGRSTDKGDTWQWTQLPFKVGGNMPGRSMGERLAIDPNKNSVLFFGARSGNGLWKSTDYGVTWSKVTSFPNPGTYVQDPSNSYQSDIMGLAWITFDPTSSTSGTATKTIYVGVADKANSIYRSTDGGATWAAVAGQPTGYLPHHGVLASTGNLFITYSDGIGPYDGTKGQVWKYNTSTGVWTDISPVASSSSDNYYGYGGLAIDAQHPNTLMVAALNSWWPDTIIFRSTDGGTTWTRIWDWNGYPNRSYRYTQDISAAPWLDFATNPQLPEITPKLGWMVGDLEIDPFNSDRMMYGTGATLYSTNNLTAWDSGGKINISVMAKGIEEEAVMDLVSPPSGAPLVSAVGDVSGFRHADVTVVPSKMLTNPTSTSSIDFAELNPTFMAKVGYNDYKAYPNGKSVALSYDGGSNWYNPSGEPSGTKGGGMIAVAADGSSLLWSTSDVGVFYSTSGNSWTASTGVPAGAKIAADRVNKTKFYASSAGKFYVSTNAGASFTQTAATGLPTDGALNFKAMPGVEGDIWLAGGSTTSGIYGLWHSTNSGASFTKLSNVQEADVVGFGKAAPGNTYMALYTSAKIDNVRGFYRSDDAGASWVRINDDLHQYGSTNSAITGDPKLYGRVYVGTNGRGIIYGDPAGTTTNNSTITPTTATFDKKTANQANIAVTMTLNGNTLSGIKNGTASLVSGTDYTVSSTTVTINKSYLATLAVGTVNLTFDFSAGTDPVLAVTVVDTTTTTSNSTITPTTATFDKNTANQANIAVTMTLNGNTLSGIKNGTASLVSGTDYTLSGTTVTINKSYLATLAVGTVNLTFDFSAGTDPALAVTVVDTTTTTSNSTITPTTATFDKKTANQANIAVTMTLNGNTLSGIKNGTASLVSGTDYTVSGTTVTINKSYLATLAVGTVNLTFDFSAGTDPVLAVTVVDTTTTTTGSIKVQMYNGNTTASINTLNPRYKLTNTGTTAISLADVKLRYYYTVDPGITTQNFWCDWSTIGSSNVTGTFVSMPTAKTGADYYVEIGFTSAAGSLAAGASIEIQTRINKTDWSNYTQTGDYSFNSASTAYTDWSKVPGYVSGALQWGIEP